jgi:two-component system, OmpR family, sensor kinase
MVSRRGVALRWRIAIFSSLAIAFLSVLASVAAYVVVRSSLVGDLRRALEIDVARVAAEYNSPQSEGDAEAETSGEDAGLATSDLRSVATGGVIIQLYSASGRRYAASNDTEEDSAALLLPPEVVVSALAEPRSWRGEIGGAAVQAALAPVTFGETQGVVAVLSPADYIGAALGELARVLAVVAGVLIVLSIGLGYLVAAAAAYPVTQLASAAAQLGPNHLVPIEYRGPDDEVGKLSAVLNDLVVRLKTSIDAQRTFLAETSHELRTPLTSLQGFLERSVRRAPPSLRAELEDAQRITWSMSRLVADLLQLTRGQLVRDYTPHLLDPCTDILKPVAEEFPGVRLEACPGSLLLGDPDRLKQLVRNLTANAVRATGNPRKVTLGLITTDEVVVLLVRDRGPGIPREMLPHIFEKFHKGAGGGAGLGLAIAKQIADAHGGSIEVESFEGRGTTFRVTLPAVQEDEDAA